MSNESSPRKPPPQVPQDIKAFNQKVIEEHRANHGQLSGMMAGRHVLLLTTTGARSGQPRTVVLGYGRDGDRCVVVASGNGAPQHPLWYRNLLKNPNATVEVGAEKLEARARTARPEERERLTPLVPYVKSEQEKTSREIPIVVLEPRRNPAG
jgi:deazaflavin-dependent oxidoreductase (nitroreductase family)